MTLPESAATLEVIGGMLRVVPLSGSTHAPGPEIAGETGYSIRDASIPAAATRAGCGTPASEDMQDRREVRGTAIRTPFSAEDDRSPGG